MSRRPKKRTKRYHGEDAKHLQAPVSSEPVVHRYSAVDRSPLKQWWFEKKKFVKPVAITSGVTLVVIWLVIELINLVF